MRGNLGSWDPNNVYLLGKRGEEIGERERRERREGKEGMVGVKRRSILVGLAFLMLMGIAVYFRLWAIDYNISSDDTELLRFPP